MTNASDTGAQLYRMIAPWTEADTWESRGAGIQTNGLEAESTFHSASSGSPVGPASIDVTADVQAWSDESVDQSWLGVVAGR